MRAFLSTLFSSVAAKAWFGAASAVVTAVVAVSRDGVIDATDIGTVVAAGLGALGVVFAVPNGKAEAPTE